MALAFPISSVRISPNFSAPPSRISDTRSIILVRSSKDRLRLAEVPARRVFKIPPTASQLWNPNDSICAPVPSVAAQITPAESAHFPGPESGRVRSERPTGGRIDTDVRRRLHRQKTAEHICGHLLSSETRFPASLTGRVPLTVSFLTLWNAAAAADERDRSAGQQMHMRAITQVESPPRPGA